MKNRLLYIISLCALLMSLPFSAKGTVAYPKPITVTQPDGTVITIRMHGDEFLHWTTSGGRLVEKCEDGFYYYASFNEDGTKKISASRVTPGSMARTGSTVVRPPQAAIMKAEEARRKHTAAVRQSAGTHIGMGEKHFLVLLIEFNDIYFTIPNPAAAFGNMLDEPGYSGNGGTGSVRDYYIDNSLGQFSPTFDVYGPVRVSKGYASYGRNNEYGWDINPGGLLAEACRLLDNEVDFSRYDIDDDGYVDNILFYFAGYDEAEGGGEDCIWAHQGYVWGEDVSLDGVKIYKYACSSELKGASGANMAGIGTACHEFGHVLGLLDYYDTDYKENGQGGGLRTLSLMDVGSYNNDGRTPPYLDGMSRVILGWMDALTPLEGTGTKTIGNVATNVAYMTPTNNEGEFYMYENRQETGWDAYTGTSGLAVYHVDQSNNSVGGEGTAKELWEQTNAINAYADHQCFDLVESVYPESAVQYTDDFTFPGRLDKTSFTAETRPALLSWDGGETGYDIYDITNSGGSVTLRLEEDDAKIVSGSVKNSAGYPLPNVNITLTAATEQTYGVIRAMVATQDNPSYTAVTDSNGEFAIDMSGTAATTFRLNASLEDYVDHNELVTINKGIKNIDIVLFSEEESIYEKLKKHQNTREQVGFGELIDKLWLKVTFFKDELVDYVDYKFKSVNFEIGGSNASEIGIFIDIDNDRVFAKVVENPRFHEVNAVDVLSENIKIPANADVSIGYYVFGTDYEYPIVVDSGPFVTGGGDYSFNGINWSGLDNWNVVISAEIVSERGIFSEKGINYIVSPKNEYDAGDVFTFKLSKSINVPVSVKWFFDNGETDESSVTLTPGEHKIKAVATYPDGSVETSLLEIIVN